MNETWDGWRPILPMRPTIHLRWHKTVGAGWSTMRLQQWWIDSHEYRDILLCPCGEWRDVPTWTETK